MGKIMAVCISDKRGVQKQSVNAAHLSPGWGIDGDAHGGDWHRQVSLLSYEKVEEFNALGAGADPGAFGENLLVSGIDPAQLPVGSLLKCGEAVLEITQTGKECHSHCQIYHKMGDCVMPREGVFAKVVSTGAVSVGDDVSVLDVSNTKKIRAAAVTLSDKASSGERQDESGKIIAQKLEQAGYYVVDSLILPDDQSLIENELKNLCDRRGVSLILTTGGTGFSARDVTPEATLSVATRLAPGIAEAVRAHSMTITKRAMLSRGVSVMRGTTLIVNLPGSPKAVSETLDYILPHLLHGIQVLLGDARECAGTEAGAK